MKLVECHVCGQFVPPRKGHRCPKCNSFLHPDPLKRLEADMADKLRQWMIEELPKLGWLQPEDFTLDPEKLETLSFDELADTIFRVIERVPSGYISSGPNYIFKMPLIGDEESGKTAYIEETAQGTFTDTYKMTTGTSFAVKTLEGQLKSGDRIQFKLNLWDLAAQPHFGGVRPLFYQGSTGALLFFNRGQHSTFKHMDKWFQELDQNAPGVPRVLVGFLDARTHPNEGLEVTRQEAEELALDYKMPYVEVTIQEEPQKTGYLRHLDAPYLKLIERIFEKKGWS